LALGSPKAVPDEKNVLFLENVILKLRNANSVLHLPHYMKFTKKYSHISENGMATKKQKLDLKNDHKETLFNDFFRAALGTMESLESQYGVTGVVQQIFGSSDDEDLAKATLRKCRAWTRLLELYDYAFYGIVSGQIDEMSIVLDGSDVIKLASSEDYWPSEDWSEIVAMSDGRFALDDGQPLRIPTLALLARVDQRTVRNAVSAGNLVAIKKSFKSVDGQDNELVFVENSSARQWLLGRRGFKPTVTSNDDQYMTLSRVTGPGEFGAFLIHQRKNLGLDAENGKLVVLHTSVNQQAITLLEAGVFSLPLNAVFPLADFYQVNRKDLLDAVMRVFFSEELTMLTATEDSIRENQT
jgi:hypothetical protein